MTTVQRVAQIFGVGFLLAAVAGFLASGGSMESSVQHAPRALGLFPVNLPHNLIHLAFGIWGLAASRGWGAAKQYCQISGVAYLGLVVLAFLSPTTFGLVPIGGNDIWLHALLGLPLAYFGFTARETLSARTA
jgi:DMSO/TMAO reductase YedYZ heme-binding membrane subunit